MFITKPFDSRQFGNYLQVKQPHAFIIHCNMHSNSKNAVHRKYFQFLKSTKNRFFIPTIKVCRCVIESWIIKSLVIKTTRRIVVFHVKRLVDYLPSVLTWSDGSSRSRVHFRGFDIFRCMLKRINFTWRSTWFPCHIIYQKKIKMNKKFLRWNLAKFNRSNSVKNNSFYKNMMLL